MLATAGDDGTVRLRETSTLTQLGQPLSGNQGAAYAVAFSPDRHTLATAGEDGRVWLWDASTRDPLPGSPFNATSGQPVHGLAFSPDGHTLATAGGDGKVRLWDATTRDPLPGSPLNASETEPVYGVAFSPNGQTLASAGQDGVLFWDTAIHTQLGRLNVSERPVYGVAFSPNGRAIATAGNDGMVRLWDSSTRTQLGQSLDTRHDAAYGVAFSPDSHTLAATGYGGPAVFWDGILWRDFADLKTLVCDLVVGNLSRAEWDALAPGLAYSTTCPS
jgi:WD40 repeat protein